MARVSSLLGIQFHLFRFICIYSKINSTSSVSNICCLPRIYKDGGGEGGGGGGGGGPLGFHWFGLPR